MEFLVRLLQEEDDIGEDDHRHQLHFASGVVQIGYTFKPNKESPIQLPLSNTFIPKKMNYIRRLLLDNRSDFLNFLFL